MLQFNWENHEVSKVYIDLDIKFSPWKRGKKLNFNVLNLEVLVKLNLPLNPKRCAKEMSNPRYKRIKNRVGRFNPIITLDMDELQIN